MLTFWDRLCLLLPNMSDTERITHLVNKTGIERSTIRVSWYNRRAEPTMSHAIIVAEKLKIPLITLLDPNLKYRSFV